MMLTFMTAVGKDARLMLMPLPCSSAFGLLQICMMLVIWLMLRVIAGSQTLIILWQRVSGLMLLMLACFAFLRKHFPADAHDARFSPPHRKDISS